MSKADEMFKKLGYKSFTKISCYHDAGDITMQELQAINLKCKELGWIE